MEKNNERFGLSDMFFFDKFLTPKVLLVLYWIAGIATMVGGFIGFVVGLIQGNWIYIGSGLGALFLGPFVVRMVFESAVLFYRIYDRL